MKEGALDASKQGLEELDEEILGPIPSNEMGKLKSLNAAGNVIRIFPCGNKFPCLKGLTSLNLAGRKLSPEPGSLIGEFHGAVVMITEMQQRACAR